MTSRFTPAAQNALKKAQEEASEMGHTYIGTEHLLLGLLSEESSVASDILKKHGLDYRNVKQAVISLNGSGSKTLSPPDMTPRLKNALERAAKEIPGAFGRIGTEQLLSSLLSEKDSVAARLIERGNKSGEMIAELGSLKNAEQRCEQRKKLPPTMAKYGYNLCEKSLDPVIGREEETEALIEALCRRRKNNPCLIGDAGVGKTAVVEGLASRMRRGEVPELLKSKVIVTLDIAAILSGAKYRGEFEERLKTVLLEASEDSEIILFIDELHTIVGTGASEGSIDAANLLKPSLARGEIRLIGATTVSEYRRHIESDPALERRFLPIRVSEPTKEETCRILHGIKSKYEEYHGIIIDDSAITSAVELSVRYIPSKRLPDKAIDLLDEAASAKRISLERNKESTSYLRGILKGISEGEGESKGQFSSVEENMRSRLEALGDAEKSAVLTVFDIEQALEKRRGNARLPTANDLFSLENDLKSAVFGQENAIKTVSNALRAGLLGINEGTSPIASFLFLGQSGVGKTALAESLAAYFYGSNDALIRLDMSEYSEQHSISRLIGSPPGYVGYRDEGQLIKEVRSKPYSVVLFDEAEKAHPDIFSLLLQVIDRGFLTDPQGKRADFRGCILILTANIDTDKKAAAGFTADESNISSPAKNFFRPELLGRLDSVVTFSPLTSDAANRIADAQLSKLKSRLESSGVSIVIRDGVRELIGAKGVKSKYGARDIFSFIKTEIEGGVISELSALKNGDIIEFFNENGNIVKKTVTKSSLSHIM